MTLSEMIDVDTLVNSLHAEVIYTFQFSKAEIARNQRCHSGLNTFTSFDAPSRDMWGWSMRIKVRFKE